MSFSLILGGGLLFLLIVLAYLLGDNRERKFSNDFNIKDLIPTALILLIGIGAWVLTNP